MPSPQRLAEAAAAVGYRHLMLDEQSHTARLLQPNMRLDLGGIAMGYAVDEVLKLLRERGIRRALVDASGDIGVGDPPPGKSGWTIGVIPLPAEGTPTPAVRAGQRRGDDFRRRRSTRRHRRQTLFAHRRSAHRPRPDRPLRRDRHRADCITADGLDTAVAVMGPKAGMELVESTPGSRGVHRRRSRRPSARGVRVAALRKIRRADSAVTNRLLGALFLPRLACQAPQVLRACAERSVRRKSRPKRTPARRSRWWPVPRSDQVPARITSVVPASLVK